MEKQATLALFDFDGTIIPGDSIVRYTRWARKKSAMSWGKFLKACLAAIGYTLRLVSSERSKTIGLSFRMDFSADERRMLDEEFVREETAFITTGEEMIAVWDGEQLIFNPDAADINGETYPFPEGMDLSGVEKI